MDERAAARAAGLRYVSDARPGFTRRRAGRGFAYFDPDGALVRDPALIARFRSLAVPPAWGRVWICPYENGHIQATARDAKGRKQYRYHPDWRVVRDEVKFDRMPLFGAKLPELRERIDADIASRDPYAQAMAAVIALLDRGALRVGSSIAYEGVGAATLRKEHVETGVARLALDFVGKGGITRRVELKDRRLARVVRRLQHLPGQFLFQVAREDGSVSPVSSTEVNDHLESVTGERFTAKEFRTWAGGVAAVEALCASGAEATLKTVLAAAAERLGNTPAVCRRSYVHPAVIERALAREQVEPLSPEAGLSGAERTFLAVIGAAPAAAR